MSGEIKAQPCCVSEKDATLSEHLKTMSEMQPIKTTANLTAKPKELTNQI